MDEKGQISNEILVNFENVSKSYSNTLAVKNLNLQIKKGEFFSFLGLNGAGKTTTIKMLTGLLVPDRGKITINNFDIVTEANKAKQIIGYVPDKANLYDKLTISEILDFSANLYNLNSETININKQNLLKEFNLLNKENDLIENLSHGMRQRLGMCLALIHNPKLLVIDEPMIGLDPHAAKALKLSLKAFIANGGTIFLSTHSLQVAESLSTKIGILHNGELIASGNMQEINNLKTQEKENLEDLFLRLTE